MQANISLRVGDQVIIKIKDIDVIKQMQANHGGWNDTMKECQNGPCELTYLIGVDAVIKAPSGSTHQVHSGLLSKYNKDMSIPFERVFSNVFDVSYGKSQSRFPDAKLKMFHVFQRDDWQRDEPIVINQEMVRSNYPDEFSMPFDDEVHHNLEDTDDFGVLFDKPLELFGLDITNSARHPGARSDIVPPTRSRDEKIEEMELKIQRLEEEKLCTICLQQNMNMTLDCGHRLCEACANKVNMCPICRKKIVKKIKNFQ